MTLSINDTQHYNKFAIVLSVVMLSHILFVVMLGVVLPNVMMLSVIALNVIILSVIVLNVIMLSINTLNVIMLSDVATIQVIL